MGGQAFRFGPGQTGFVPRGMEHEVRAYTEARHIAILTRKGAEALPLAA
jgi:quercetin dioxygenase-like cupin family protein